MHFAQETETILIRAGATLSSVAATDIINMENYDKVTFIVTMGTVTTGGNISIRQMDSVSDTVSAESRLALDYYYEKTHSASGSITKTSADSISSYGGITVADADDSKMYIFEVRGEMLTSSNNCVALYFDTSAFNATPVQVTAVCHRARYKQTQPVTALA